jgi:hypothetical protein
MAIKNVEYLKDLQPFARMTVVPGVTVGDLNFSSAQSYFSTGYIGPQTSSDQLDANSEVDLFQAAIGDNGQGLASGVTMTRGQTNVLDSQGRLPANEVFIGIKCLVSVYKHVNAAVGATGATLTGSTQTTFGTTAALESVLKSFSWEFQIGDGIIRNAGALIGYPQGGGVWEPTTAAAVAAGAGTDVQSGLPLACDSRKLPIPFLFLPNIVTRVKVKNGGAIAGLSLAKGAADTAGQFAAFRMTFQGYKLTMPV